MTQITRRKIALLGKVPPDIHAGLVDDYELLDAAGLACLDAAQKQAITHGLTSAMSGVDLDALTDLPALKMIASVGAGTDRFDMGQLSAKGITLHATPDVMTEDTAECAVGLIFALLRNVVANDGFVRSGDWASARAPLGSRISARKIGIVGLGRIGSRVAQKLSALGCEVMYHGRTEKQVRWPFVSDVGALADQVDVLVLTCAGGAQTRGMVDAALLRRLGQDGFLINVSRGSVVDEPALITALQQGQIAGAALDVFEAEPTPDPRFLQVQNCILSPHAAVFTHENRRDLIAEIRRLLALDRH